MTRTPAKASRTFKRTKKTKMKACQRSKSAKKHGVFCARIVAKSFELLRKLNFTPPRRETIT